MKRNKKVLKISKSLILQEAKEVKAFVVKNKKIPKYVTISNSQLSPAQYVYLLCKFIGNVKVESIDKIVVKDPSEPNGTSINTNVVKVKYVDMAKRVASYIEKNKQAPNYVSVDKYNVRFELYVYAFTKIVAFYKENNYLPNYCLFNSSDIQYNKTSSTSSKKSTSTSTSSSKNVVKNTKNTNCENPYTSSPHYTSEGCNRLGQCTGYFCAPHSIHQAIKKFGITKFSESQIAQWCGTTTNGTGHDGINTAIAKISKETGIKLTVQWKYFSDMGSTDEEKMKAIAKILCDKNKALLWHIAYINGGNSTNGKHFGHYEYIDKINILTKYVRALNSLGTKKGDGSYTGKLQDRPYSIQSYFARNTPGGQKALCIISRG